MAEHQEQLWTGPVERLAWGGLGVGRLPDGRIVLLEAPLALFPGEAVEAELTMLPRHAEGRVTKWLKPDAQRTEPACPLAERCGACSLWGAGATHDALKHQMVEDLFHRQLPEAPRFSWSPAPENTCRSRIQLHWDGGQLGYHAKGTNEVVEIEHCPIAVDALNRAIPAVAEALRSGELPSDPARWELATGTPPGAVVALCESRPGTTWRWHNGQWQTGAQPIMHKFPGARLRQSPATFFQASPAWAWQAFSSVFTDWNVKGSTLFDLYGGGGFFSRMLGSHFKRVSLVESNPLAVHDARLNLGGLEAAVHAVSVDDWPPGGVGEPGDVLLLDPPRAGLSKRVVAGVNDSLASTLILVGCDGANFCRDIKRLSRSWQVSRLAVIDLFPNTPNVECLALLKRIPPPE